MAKWIKVNSNSVEFQGQGAYVNLDQIDAIGVNGFGSTWNLTFHVVGSPMTGATGFYNSVTVFPTAVAAHEAVAKLLGKSDLPSL